MWPIIKIKCKGCKKYFETRAPNRKFCYAPACEKKRTADRKKTQQICTKKWREANKGYFNKYSCDKNKTAKLKPKDIRRCVRIKGNGKTCNKLTRGNWLYCPECHHILTYLIPDTDYVYY